MRQIVISDIHLGSKNSRARDVLSLLQTKADRFILNGDIVDSVNFKRFRKTDWAVTEKIRQLARDGMATLIQGNHDTHLEAVTGLPLVPCLELHAAGKRWLVMHGDFFDPTLNWPVITDIADWCYNTAQSVHKKSARLAKHLFKKYGGVIEVVQKLAVQFAKQREYDGILTGHTHFADDVWINGIRYLNSGCWTDDPAHYIEITDHSVSLKQW